MSPATPNPPLVEVVADARTSHPAAQGEQPSLPAAGPAPHSASPDDRAGLIAHLRTQIQRLEGRSLVLTTAPCARAIVPSDPSPGRNRAEAGSHGEPPVPRDDRQHAEPWRAGRKGGCSNPPRLADLPPSHFPAPFAETALTETAADTAAHGEWTFGVSDIDRALPGGGLDLGSLHEVKPADPAATSAAIGLALRLAIRRLTTRPANAPVRTANIPGDTDDGGLVLWCWTRAAAREHGRLSGHGLATLGLALLGYGNAQHQLVLVEAARTADVLWAMEEGARSGAASLVVGHLAEIAATPARRLALASAATRTPSLLLTHARSTGAVATATRWRASPAPSGPHPLVASNPGQVRLALALERCRHGDIRGEGLTRLVEWSDDTHRFRLAPALADRAPRPRSAWRRAG